MGSILFLLVLTLPFCVGNSNGQNLEDEDFEEYEEENAWVRQSDFEGSFENEVGGLDAEGDEDEYVRVDDLLRNYDIELDNDEPDVVGGIVDDKIDNVKKPLRGQEETYKEHLEGDGEGKVVEQQEITGEVQEKHSAQKPPSWQQNGKNELPSFENTPMPKKKSFSVWRSHKKKEYLRNQSPPFELTSSLYLIPESSRYAGGNSYVAACLIVRDEQEYISEWINHHLNLDIKPIYLYDHFSLPPLKDYVERYIKEGLVVYESVEYDEEKSDGLSPQLYVYRKCLRDHGAKHKWLTFFDVDEFLMFRQGHPVQGLPSLLVEYEHFSALAVHWILFGSSDHESRPLKGVLRSYRDACL